MHMMEENMSACTVWRSKEHVVKSVLFIHLHMRSVDSTQVDKLAWQMLLHAEPSHRTPYKFRDGDFSSPAPQKMVLAVHIWSLLLLCWGNGHR